MQINKEIIPVNQKKQRPGYAMDPKYITVHNTANASKGADAEMHARYLLNGAGGREVGWHFTVDDHSIYQHLPLNENGWHAGDGRGNGNMKSIGIEICENADGDFDKACKNAQWLIKKLMKEHNIGINNVVPHKHWSGKNCPHLLLNMWGTFKEGIGGKSTYTPHKKQTGSQTVKNNNILQPGDRGATVRQMQEDLASVYFYPDKGAKNNGIDGIYGPKTKDAVRRFQSMHGLAQDGIFGPKTRAALNKAMGKKSKPKKSKSISQMAREIIAGKHGNGNEARRKSLGISKAEYEKVRAEVNKRL